MPTGYTASIADGKVGDLKTFALQCARGMGALVMMREDPWDTPIPVKFEPSDYHDKKLVENKTALAELDAMSPTDLQSAFEADTKRILDDHEKYEAQKTEQHNRYNAMLDKVVEWQGAPEGLKEFMLQQLRQSIDFDCDPGVSPVTAPDAQAWKAVRIEKLHGSIGYHAAEREKEIIRTEQRNRWLTQLRASLPVEP